MQSPDLDALTVRFDNAGVIQRALDAGAQMLGMSHDDIVAQWMMLLPFLIGDAGGPVFQEKLQTALVEFLKDPKSLTIKLAPAEPVPLNKAVRTFYTDQTKLPDLLGMDIIVNK